MTKKTKSRKSGVSAGAVIGVGAGIAALGAATYLLFGPNGKKNQKLVRGWVVKMKGEIIEEFEKVKEVTESVYHDTVDKVAAKYMKLKGIDQEELKAVISDIKKHWKGIEKEAKGKSKKKKTTKK